ncbi:CpsB/CapC family capsule biosynthesis tyrosine phosphatase [Zhenpiania hominis]|uniref:protein-tyrosine-phosphatase n=1 Tax=Zhenpiania hominis TaxID=2763644 RepID=A0A923NIC3_9FIRM|nr:CpsB/CapC family capsule biosynthesis tyrosine phosphatase [Zhenpiania hominis]MBC6679576.1 hypothetical protein [Zhenpiania hominis]
MGEKWIYTDIHAHIIPGVDDGSSSMEESLEMAELAYQEGVRAIIATPHYGRRNPEYNTNRTVALAMELREKIKKNHPDLSLFLGNELYYSPGIIEEVNSRKAFTLGSTNYALVEFDVLAEYPELKRCIREFVMEGYRPILAHTERYRCLFHDISRVKELIEQGAYIQVNTRGFIQKKREERSLWCWELLETGLIHFIASDCHNMRERKPIMKTAIREMVKLAGEEAVKEIVYANIFKLLKNEYI